jgi:hypothetical protein
MGQATGQPKCELFSESEIQLFLAAVAVQITFVRMRKGKWSGGSSATEREKDYGQEDQMNSPGHYQS